ncbi:hypothetical protein GCM10007170_08110 [Arthrobacter liuii]|uniref:Uncharacterized protein n=1 Tax=Arthrobacter liuii TaxID=1476996 RepID=A0ABQ2AKI0_9MICC|nr:hypothetical protein GCM10007170_08110 [Arthrobacter liuii]
MIRGGPGDAQQLVHGEVSDSVDPFNEGFEQPTVTLAVRAQALSCSGEAAVSDPSCVCVHCMGVGDFGNPELNALFKFKGPEERAGKGHGVDS